MRPTGAEIGIEEKSGDEGQAERKIRATPGPLRHLEKLCSGDQQTGAGDEKKGEPAQIRGPDNQRDENGGTGEAISEHRASRRGIYNLFDLLDVLQFSEPSLALAEGD